MGRWRSGFRRAPEGLIGDADAIRDGITVPGLVVEDYRPGMQRRAEVSSMAGIATQGRQARRWPGPLWQTWRHQVVAGVPLHWEGRSVGGLPPGRAPAVGRARGASDR